MTQPRINALDPTFGSDGKVTTDFGLSNDTGRGMAIQADGKMVVAGYSQNGPNTDIALPGTTRTAASTPRLAPAAR
jgi:hypothetical protein